MNFREKQEIIKTTIAECAKADGWANLAQVGAALRKKGLKYRSLHKVLANYKFALELKTDYMNEPPVIYAKVK